MAMAAAAAMVVQVTVAAAGDSVSSEPVDSALAGKSIQSGLERSPDHLVAGVLEVVGEAKCDDRKDDPSCVNDAKLVEALASRGREFKPGDRLTFLGEALPGARYLAVLVPVDAPPGAYGATWLSAGVTEGDRRVFVAELERAGLKLHAAGSTD
jgi:hypothetical protein